MGNPEAEAMNVRRGRHAGPAILKYPLDLGETTGDSQNFVLFQIKPGGPKNRSSSTHNVKNIALHIPPGALKTQYGGNYSPVSGGRVFEEHGMNLAAVGMAAGLGAMTKNPIFAIVAGLAGGAGMGMMKGQDFGEALMGSGRAVKDAGVAAGTLMAGSLSGMLQPVTAGMGIAINPHTALLYNGPDAFRKHGFTFDFWPDSYEEAKTVKEIILSIKSSMLPKMKSMSVFKSIYFDFPDEFFINFFIGYGKHSGGVKKFDQMQIKRSVLTDLTVDYDGGQGPAFYEPPTSQLEPMPVHTKATMNFQETEFIIDYPKTGETSEEADAHKPATVWAPSFTDTNVTPQE